MLAQRLLQPIKLASGMVNPQKSHWDILARLEAYKTTYPEMGIVFRAASPPEILQKGHNLDCLALFADSDLAGDITDSKSTSGYSCHLGESGMFDWKCKKQTCVCQSSCESETLSSKLATCTAIWLRNGLSDMGFTFTRPTPVCQDNQSAIALCESDRHHSRTRHFRMHVHFLKDCQAKRITCYPWVPTAHMRGDMFNKMHGPIVHERLLEMNQMSPHPIHALDADPKPMVVYGWVERRAKEKAEENAKSQQGKTKTTEGNVKSQSGRPNKAEENVKSQSGKSKKAKANEKSQPDMSRTTEENGKSQSSTSKKDKSRK